ncbi:NHLP bacteriocin system secretion protein [Lewinella sp. LCG006]|uniref:NHLP bacteriocin system secretion protein n=1 Tax=Lewinella sp. LCG006 TaxID=3231911 RepID=UPI003460456B
MAAPSFFRKSALEKLSTPEKLDQLIKVTSPRAWIALLTIVIALVTALSWGFMGRVKTKINTAGILLGGEVYDVVSTTQGQLLELDIEVGEQVAKGDIIATIDQPELLQQVQAAEASLVERRYELEQLQVYGSKDAQIQGDLLEQSRRSIQQQIRTTEKNIVFLKQQLATERELLEKGLITKPQVVGSEQAVENAQNQIEGLKAQLVQMTSQALNAGFNQQQQLTVVQQRIAQEELRLEQLREQYETKSAIRSPHDGEVVEVLSTSGEMVGLGTPLFKLKNDLAIAENGNIRGILYVPSQDGKKIKVGMEALVVPATVKPQEHGYMKAKVTYVSAFPVTQQGMMTSMKNDQLVNNMLRMGAPYEVYVEFEKNPQAYSGYEWTSAKGPEITINAGTSCSGKITVKQEPPIAMVVPALKKFFDLY